MIVVIPAYEPDEKLLGVLSDFTEHTSFPIVVVNDGSSDACRSVFDAVKEYSRVTLLTHEKNRGKGAALKTAFAYIADSFPDTEGVLTVDADGQHLLHDCMNVCAAYDANPNLLITGSRRFKGKVPLRSRIGNSITRGVFRLTTGKRIYDTQTGLRAFAAKRIPEMLALKGDRYEYEIHQLLYCCTNSTGVLEVPIDTVYIDDNSSSHFDTLRDSAKIYKVIFKFLGPTFLKFMSTSFVSFLIDFLSFCLIFYGTIAAFGGFSIAKEMFSFQREVSQKWSETLLALNPIVFVGGGSVLRMVSLVLARVISGFCNYLLNRRFVFAGSRKDRNLLKYALTAVSVLLLNWLFIELFTRAGVPAWLANILSQLICYPISFMLQRTIVFRKQNEQA
jgi:glycosyltransferase involved in cell wall biosynthesis